MIVGMPDANAVRFFQDKLAYETSPREVVDSIHAGENITIVDVRRPEAFAKGHVTGAVNLTLSQISDAPHRISKAGLVIVYDWGPASTWSTRAALSLAAQGYQVRQMLGGFEYWSRMGLGIEGPDGILKRRASDPLVTTSAQGWD
jgi:rhodanese-related sulfurtransferase